MAIAAAGFPGAQPAAPQSEQESECVGSVLSFVRSGPLLKRVLWTRRVAHQARLLSGAGGGCVSALTWVPTISNKRKRANVGSLATKSITAPTQRTIPSPSPLPGLSLPLPSGLLRLKTVLFP